MQRGTAARPGARVVQALPSGIHAEKGSSGYGSPGAAKAGAARPLYLIHNPLSGLVKVGRSVAVQKRLNALQSGAGQVMTLVKQFERKGLCELACHEKLSAWHTPPGKEWFSASPEQVLEIVEQVVRDAQELSEDEEEDEEEGVSEETSLPEA